MARVLVFDVIETVLDLRQLREPFARAFGDPPPVGEWFARLLHDRMVAAHDWDVLGAMRPVASRRRDDRCGSSP